MRSKICWVLMIAGMLAHLWTVHKMWIDEGSWTVAIIGSVGLAACCVGFTLLPLTKPKNKSAP